jgi:hypothetical protein
VEMISECPQDSVWAAVGLAGGGEVAMEAVNSHAHGAGGALGAVPGPGGVLLFVVVQGDELAFDFPFDGLEGGFVVEDSFELILLAQDGAHDLGLVESETAFLDPGIRGEEVTWPVAGSMVWSRAVWRGWQAATRVMQTSSAGILFPDQCVADSRESSCSIAVCLFGNNARSRNMVLLTEKVIHHCWLRRRQTPAVRSAPTIKTTLPASSFPARYIYFGNRNRA